MHHSGVLFSDAARNLRQIGHSRATWLLVIVITAIQAGVSLLGGVDEMGSFYEALGLSRHGFISGKVWQIVTYGFLHGGWLHAGLNALFLLAIGSRIEHVIGWKAMLGSAFACVAGGGALHLLSSSGLLVGMSGGCVGLLLLLVTLSPQSRMFPLPVSGRSLGAGLLIAELLFVLMDPALGLSFASSAGRWFESHGWAGWFQVGHACHLAGGIVGWLCGLWILRPPVTLARLRRDRARREARLNQKAR